MNILLCDDFPCDPASETGLASFFRAIAELSAEGISLEAGLATDLKQQLEEQRLPRKCLLLDIGDIPRRVYHIVSGYVVLYISQVRDGVIRPVATYILEAGDFILPLELIEQLPSPLLIQLSTKATLVSLSATKYARLMDAYAQVAQLALNWRDRMEMRWLYEQSRIRSYPHAVDRLLWMMTRWTDYKDSFVSDVIADYIGVGRSTVFDHQREAIRLYLKGERRY